MPIISFINIPHYIHTHTLSLFVERYKIVSAKQLERAAEAYGGKVPASGTKINIAPPAPGSEPSKTRKCC